MLLLAWVGCTGSVGGASFDPPDTDSTAADADTDTDTDTDTDADTAGDTAADSGGPPPDTRPVGSCTPTLPDDVQVLRADADLGDDGVRVWVCRGATVSSSGAMGAYFVDDRAETLLSGTDGRVWVRSGATLTVFAGPNELWVEDGATVHVEAEGVVLNTCPTLTFSGGPTDGC